MTKDEFRNIFIEQIQKGNFVQPFNYLICGSTNCFVCEIKEICDANNITSLKMEEDNNKEHFMKNFPEYFI